MKLYKQQVRSLIFGSLFLSYTCIVEAMGQAIAKNGGQICEVVMKLLRDCSWDLRLEILKDINVLMIRREENVQVYRRYNGASIFDSGRPLFIVV